MELKKYVRLSLLLALSIVLSLIESIIPIGYQIPKKNKIFFGVNKDN